MQRLASLLEKTQLRAYRTVKIPKGAQYAGEYYQTDLNNQ